MVFSFNRLYIIIFAGCLLALHSPVRSQQTALAGPHRSASKPTPASPILPGADQMEKYLPLLKGANVAIFANQTAVVGNTHLVDTLLKAGVHISKIFSPEHGFRGDADAGEHVGSITDPKT